MRNEIRATKAYLNQIRSLDNVIRGAAKRLETIRRGQTYISGISYDKPAVQTSRSGDAGFENDVFRLMDVEQEVQIEIAAATETKQRLIGQIYSLEDYDYVNLLSWRYVDGYNMAKIGNELYLSEDRLKHLMADATMAFYEKFKASIDAYDSPYYEE